MGRGEKVKHGLGKHRAGYMVLCLLFYPEDGGDSSSKILFYFHWVISQKMQVFVVTTVRISNPEFNI
jgi:hypothetical protein